MNRRTRLLAGGLAACLCASWCARALAQDQGGGDEQPAQRTIVPPKLVKFVEAEFPQSEAAAGKGATVVLQIAIDATGAVADVKVLESAGAAFDTSAVAAAKQFVFTPALVDGKPIPVKITYKYVFTFTEKMVKKTTADFEGVVRDRRTKQPLADVRVAVDTGQSAVTDEQGHFKIADIPVGEHGVTLSGEKLTSVGTTETFEASKKIDAVYEVEPKKEKTGNPDEEEEIVVTAPRIKKQVISTEVKAEQAVRVPGTQGDVLKVVENLPGVARAAAGSGALAVWGSAPQDTRVYVDGIHVPRLYHDGGYRSIINSDFVKSVELVPGAYGASYGRGLGGLVTVSLKPLDEDGVHGSVAADTIDAAASVRAKVADKWHVAIAARKSYLDSTTSLVTSQNVGEYIPIPQFWDGQARVVYDVGAHETLELGGMVSSDKTTRSLPNADPSLATSQTTTTDFKRIYFRYVKHLKEGGVVEVVPSYGKDSTSLLNVYGSTPTDVTNDSDVFGLRASWHGPVTKHFDAAFGVDGELYSSTLHRYGSIGYPPREGDKFVFGEAPPRQVDSDDWKTVIGSVAPFVEGDVALLDDKLHVIPGARLDPLITMTNKVAPPQPGNPNIAYQREDPVIEPRLAVLYAFTPRISAKVAYGEYHQSPQAEELSAGAGNPTLGLSYSQHELVGTKFQLTQLLSVETTAFYRTMNNLVVRTENRNPVVGHALDQIGIGRAYGVQFLLRQDKGNGRFFGWISYTISRSERQDAPNLPWRLFDYDQTHVFTALGSYDLGLGFEVGARFRFASGYPRTPVTGAYYDVVTDTYEPIFGFHNSIRIPSFYSLDVRFAKHFRIGRTSAEVYLDVQNVTDHTNDEEIVYNPNYTQRGYITGFPILPVLGARWAW
jgi:TonB family protein